MRLFITGGAGFIGSHVVQRALAAGHAVTVFDNLSHGYRALVDPRADFVAGELGDRAAVATALAGHDAVIHLAATSIIQQTIADPAATYENNLTNGIHLLEAMRQTGVMKLINSSTAAVYGEPERVPVHETDRKHPITPYGASKYAFEIALGAYHACYGLESVSLRYFNAYGPRDEQQPRSRAVPKWIAASLHNHPIEVYWKGRQYRDYVYVGDIAEAHLRVLPLAGCHAFNVGTAQGVYMADVLQTIGQLTGMPPIIHDKGDRPGDPARLVADTSRLLQATGWHPQTPLLEGLSRTVAYYRRSIERGPHFDPVDGM